jgi:putative phosphoribosyl transferase
VLFRDRVDAGRRLGERLRELEPWGDVVVVGLPRGGVPVAAEVARALSAPLDVILVRKLGLPYQPEVAMGAIGEGGVRVLDDRLVRLAGVRLAEVHAVEAREEEELQRRAWQFRRMHPRVSVEGRTVIVVDDGVATGSTARAACQVARAQGARRVVLAVPVASPDWRARIGADADEFVVLATPSPFRAVGEWYDDFSQTTDREVLRCLERSAEPTPAPGSAAWDRGDRGSDCADDPLVRAEEVAIPVDGVRLAGRLAVPEHAEGVVVFVHGSGSGRHSPRSQLVAGILRRSGLATVVFDLLTPDEAVQRDHVFDLELLGGRLLSASQWLEAHPDLGDLPVGWYGPGTGAAAALWAAADRDCTVRAVVSRGGRPDLVGPRLGLVHAPTLLIVGSRDDRVLELNRRALAQMRCRRHLAVVPGAGHLFQEPGAFPAAAAMAKAWFVEHLVEPADRPVSIAPAVSS